MKTSLANAFAAVRLQQNQYFTSDNEKQECPKLTGVIITSGTQTKKLSHELSHESSLFFHAH